MMTLNEISQMPESTAEEREAKLNAFNQLQNENHEIAEVVKWIETRDDWDWEDIAQGIATGPVNMTENVMKNVGALLGADEETTERDLGKITQPIKEVIGTVDTTEGNVAEGISRAISGVGTSTIVAPLGFASKAAQYTGYLARGASTDALIWSEDDGRLSDILSEAGVNNLVVDYLKSDPNDSKTDVMIKNAIEGVLMNVAVDTVIEGIAKGYKTSKANLWSKNGNDPELVAKEVDEILSKDGYKIPSEQEQLIEKTIKKEILEQNKLDNQVITLNYDKLNLSQRQMDVLKRFEASDDVRQYLIADTKSNKITDAQSDLLKKVIGEDVDAWGAKLIANTEQLPEQLLATKKVLVDRLDSLDSLYTSNTTEATLEMMPILEELITLTAATKNTQKAVAQTQQIGKIAILSKELLGQIEDMKIAGTFKSGAILDKAMQIKINKAVKELLDTKNSTSLENAINKLAKDDGFFTKLFNSLNEIRSAGLLSYWTTGMINITGNAAVRMFSRFEDVMTYVYGLAPNAKERMLFDELQARSADILGSISDTAKGIAKGVKEWNPKDGTLTLEDLIEKNYIDRYSSKLDTASSHKKVSSEYWMDITEDSTTLKKGIAYLGDAFGTTVRLPYHVLGATDDAFKRMVFSSELPYLITREANRKGLKGLSKEQFINDMTRAHKIIMNLDPKSWTKSDDKLVRKYITDAYGDSLIKAAMEKARVETFQEGFKRGKDAGYFDKLFDSFDRARVSGPIGEAILPFYRTPINILKWSGRRVPFTAAFSKSMREDIAAGGLRRHQAMARLTTGSMLMAIGWYAYESGFVLGGANSYQDEKALKTAGIQTRSLKIGDNYVDLNRFDPVITPMMLAADMARIYEEAQIRGMKLDDNWEELMGNVITAFSANVMDKAFFTGFSDLITAIQRQDSKYFSKMAGTYVPYSSLLRNSSAYNNVMGEMPDTYVEAVGLIENFQKQFAQWNNREALDVFGKPVLRDTKFMGLNISELSKQPGRLEIGRLRVPLSNMDDSITFKGITVKLSAADHWKMRRLLDTKYKIENRINNLVQSYEYLAAPDGVSTSDRGTKKFMIAEEISKTKSNTKAYFIENNPDIMSKYFQEYDKHNKDVMKRSDELWNKMTGNNGATDVVNDVVETLQR